MLLVGYENIREIREEMPPDIEERLNGPGFREIGSGIFVCEEDAYEYAMERISQDEDLKQEFLQWFYLDGDWVREE